MGFWLFYGVGDFMGVWILWVGRYYGLKFLVMIYY